jgi:hypothetical protein
MVKSNFLTDECCARTPIGFKQKATIKIKEITDFIDSFVNDRRIFL